MPRSIGCARVLNPADQYADRQYNAREMTVPVLDRQSGVPVRVYGVVPKMSLTPWAHLAWGCLKLARTRQTFSPSCLACRRP